MVQSYDVFLSFRGEDTRHTFTGHLYDALCRKGIFTFMDDEQLRVGEQIGPSLLQAIEESKISIIVFSENYAESTWCLNELVKILECMKEKNQLVWPIFYKVEPSDVRHQKQSYGEAITKHETRFGRDSEMVHKWKSALFQVSNLKGYHLKDGYEFKFIQELVSKASIKISPKDLDTSEHTVGLEHQVEKLKSLLEIESRNGTFFLGIHGTGGIGKTTLTKALYNSIYKQFEGACFLFNVREISNQFQGLIHLQQRLLSEILEEGNILLKTVNEGTRTIKRRLGQNRVLVVLDDVDDIKQLENLSGDHDWFGFGSRIIITTRDKHLLDVHKVEKRYEVSVLNNNESLELFCQTAFKKNHSDSNYEDLSNCAIRYAKGLPLALKLIGSNLIGKDLDEWRSALDKYEKNPHRDIQSILRISYDSLDCNEKDIFLDIACFFKGERLEYVKKVLDACEFYAEDGIRTLVDKSLVTIKYGCLRMHDLIQDMGREIVKQEAPREVGERSRLWSYEDVLQVLTQNTGSTKIEGIMLDPPKVKYFRGFDRTAFMKMNNLRILIVRNTVFLCGPNYLSNQLRLLEWFAYPLRAFPQGFCPKKIVTVNVRKSPLVLEKPFQRFEHLTYMTISHCAVTKFPDVSGAKNLRELRLDKCIKLVAVHESVGHLPNLVYLRASECPKLRCFLRRICLPSLEYLSFNFCKRLARFPDIVGKMDKPLKISMIGTAVRELPQSIGKLTGLNFIEMTICKELRNLPSSLFELPNFVTLKIGGCSGLPESSKKFKGRHLVAECCPNLGTLHFGYAGLSDEDIYIIICSFPNLKDLNVSGNKFVSLPAHIKESIYLTSLDVSFCKELKKIPELPSSIQKIDTRLCNSLSRKTSRMLWSQVCKEINRLEINMPWRPFQDREEFEEIEEKQEAFEEIEEVITIPKWFDHRSKGGIPVFRAREKFPVVALAFRFGEVNVRSGSFENDWQRVGLHLFIEGEHVHSKQYYKFIVAEGHVLLCDLRVLFSDEEWEGLDACVGHDWKTIQIDCETDLSLRCWGVYVYKQETNMKNIEFKIPDPCSSGISNPWSLVQLSQEDKIRNKIESLDLPAMMESMLEDGWLDERIGCFDFIFERLEMTTLATAAWWRMSRRAAALREGKDASESMLEDDVDEEDDFMLQRFAEGTSGDEEGDGEEDLTCLENFSLFKNSICLHF